MATSSPLPRIVSRLDGGNAVDDDRADAEQAEGGSTRPHLVLHFDINETCLVGDDAGGDTREDCLNKILAKSAFVRMDDGGGGGGEDEAVRRQPPLAETKGLDPARWWDGTPIDGGDEPSRPAPPLYTGWSWPPRCCPYYRTSRKRRAKTFTEPCGDGRVYRPLYVEIERRLSLADHMCDGVEGIGEHHPFHHMLPAFFRTLSELRNEGRSFTLVLRTFGSDLEDVAGAVSDFARGRHPAFPDFRAPDLVLERDGMFRGRWRKPTRGGGIEDFAAIRDGEDCRGEESIVGVGVGTIEREEGATYELHRWDENDHVAPNPHNDGGSITVSKGEVAASGDEEILSIIEGRTVVGIQDDYQFWSDNGCDPRSGKPVWVSGATFYGNNSDGEQRQCQHIFFDDNIHNDPTDSIVAVRMALANTKTASSFPKNGGRGSPIAFRTLSGSEVVRLHGRHIVRVPTIEPIMDEWWFLRQIAQAEAAVSNESKFEN